MKWGELGNMMHNPSNWRRRSREKEDRVGLLWVAHQNQLLSCCSLFIKTGLMKDRQKTYWRLGRDTHTYENTKDLLRVCQSAVNEPKALAATDRATMCPCKIYVCSMYAHTHHTHLFAPLKRQLVVW